MNKQQLISRRGRVWMQALACVLVWALSWPAQADAIADLQSFLSQSQSLHARFKQVQAQRKKEVLGEFWLQKPQRFRWDYAPPSNQKIIADGQFLWVVDLDLNQVTQKNQTQALADSPASWLLGQHSLSERFVLKNMGESQGLVWVQALPKKSDQSLARLSIGLKDKKLMRLDIEDGLGQVTHLEFADWELNPKLAGSIFQYSPPEGTDVVRQ